MHILISGGTGFIGRSLCHFFLQQGHQLTVLSRAPEKAQKLLPPPIECIGTLSMIQDPVDAIINLAGEPLNRRRWTTAIKQELIHSRLATTDALVSYIKRSHYKPSVFISGSAIGYYGSSRNAIFNEKSAPADHGFTHSLCHQWESTALQAAPYTRVCLIRTGIVLGVGGGAISDMLPAFRWGLGAQLADGQEWMSWIHLFDLIHAIDYLMNKEDLSGPFNLTAPKPVTNEIFSQCLAQALHRKCRLRLSPYMIKLLFGEMGTSLLLNGQNVVPTRLQEQGFHFLYPDLEGAFRQIVTQSRSI